MQLSAEQWTKDLEACLATLAGFLCMNAILTEQPCFYGDCLRIDIVSQQFRLNHYTSIITGRVGLFLWRLAYTEVNHAK